MGRGKLINKVFTVTDLSSGEKRYVNAKNRVLAWRAVAQTRFSVEKTTPEELVSLLGSDVIMDANKAAAGAA